MSGRIDVGLLGATGTVGTWLAGMLQGHPWFRLAEVGASPGSVGRAYGEAAALEGLPGGAVPGDDVRALTLKPLSDEWKSPLLLSALPSREAGPVEEELAGRGHVVVSNAASHRMDLDVPLIIPEVNPDHIDLVHRQERWAGTIVTNPNCSVIGLALVLAPLHRTFGLQAVSVVTLQALSGAGRPGPSAADMLDNVLPHIGGEEEKLECEPQKILGALEDGRVRPAAFPVSAQTHRVPVAHGHLLAVSVKFEEPAGPDDVAAVLSGFRGAVLEERLPSAPDRAIEVVEDPTRPQPRLDRDRGAGMTVTVGRVRSCETFDVKFSALVHNLVRGAAGAALLNAELCHVFGCTAGARAR
ncbi:MAG: aspartate-semialdehyde dehydrogenase [Gemmatimonadota bacterium]|nr:MAG: aspartate-semialdehyde dehydrogenase [Gemmatimonadota bacterium]